MEWLDQREPEAERSIEPLRPPVAGDLSEPWTLTHGVMLAPWQVEARRAWVEAGRRGTAKVVTGAGKTILALAAAEELQRTEDRELRVVIVVPTIVLLNQWYDALLAHSALPAAAIGRMGGGHSGSFVGGCRIVIAVLASAYRLLPRDVREAGVAEHLLLIVDECHRAGAPEQSAVLGTPHSYALGLSATPERSDDAVVSASAAEEGPFDGLSDAAPESSENVDDYDASPVGRALGATVYELSLADAVARGILPPFELHHFGLSLTEGERRRYDELTRQISDLRKELRESSSAARKAGAGGTFLAWCRRVGARRADDIGTLARRFVGLTTDRKRLLYAAESRRAATISLVREALDDRVDARVILFHESIDEVTALFEMLVAEGIPAGMEHSKLPDRLREESLELFRSGAAKVIVSARSLVEGFNVPAADLGIIVASSSSPRQRIQSVGRVLRRHRDARDAEKVGRVCVLYVRDTTDDLIYERADWGRIIGVERNRYFWWDPPSPPVLRDGPPRTPLPTESEIEFETLEVGAEYPGAFQGDEFSCDTRGNVVNAQGQFAIDAQGIPDILRRLTGNVGRFRVTPRKRAILVRRPEGDRWRTLYGGCLERTLEFRPDDLPGATAESKRDANATSPSSPRSGGPQSTVRQPRSTLSSSKSTASLGRTPEPKPRDDHSSRGNGEIAAPQLGDARDQADVHAPASSVAPAAEVAELDVASAISGVVDSSELRPGHEYHGPTAPVKEYKFSRKRGGVIEKRVRDGWVFATGAQAEQLIHVLLELSGSSSISKFYINALRHAYWRADGLPRFIAALDGELSFPAIDDHQ